MHTLVKDKQPSVPLRLKNHPTWLGGEVHQVAIEVPSDKWAATQFRQLDAKGCRISSSFKGDRTLNI